MAKTPIEVDDNDNTRVDADILEGGLPDQNELDSLFGDGITANGRSLAVDADRVKKRIGALSESEIDSAIESKIDAAVADLNDSSPAADLGGSGDGMSSAPPEATDVRSLGVKTDGSECTASRLNENVKSGEHYWFPSGEYLFTTNISLHDKSDITFEFADGAVVVTNKDGSFGDEEWYHRTLFRSNKPNPVTDLTIRNLTVEFRSDKQGHGILNGHVAGNCLVEDVDVRGEWTWGGPSASLFTIATDNDETAMTFRNVWIPDGSIHDQQNYHEQPIPFLITAPSAQHSRVRFENCLVVGYANNAIYAAKGAARILVDGGLYLNNDHSNIRIGGTSSVVKNAVIGVDENVDTTYDTCRNLWLRHGVNHRVEGCILFRLNDDVNSEMIEVSGNGGSAHITETHMVSTDDGWGGAVTVNGSDDSDYRTGSQDDNMVTIDNCTIHWDYDGRELPAIDVRRSNTKVEDVRFFGDETGGDQAAVRFREGATGSEFHHRYAQNVSSLARVDADEVTITGAEPVSDGVAFVGNGNDLHVSGRDIDRGVDVKIGGDRTVVNGAGVCEGNPNGKDNQWHNHGYDGLCVWQTDHPEHGYYRFQYVEGAFRTPASM